MLYVCNFVRYAGAGGFREATSYPVYDERRGGDRGGPIMEPRYGGGGGFRGGNGGGRRDFGGGYPPPRGR